LVFREQATAELGDNLLVLDLETGEERPLLAGPANERNAELSPDGRWMAYQSDESGQFEIYVRPFPDVESDRIQVSNNGGQAPLWSRDGEELFYLEVDSRQGVVAGNLPVEGMRMVRVEVVRGAPGRPLRFANRSLLFDPWPYMYGGAGRTFDIALDGRFLAIRDRATATDGAEAVVVQNFVRELERLVSTN